MQPQEDYIKTKKTDYHDLKQYRQYKYQQKKNNR